MEEKIGKTKVEVPCRFCRGCLGGGFIIDGQSLAIDALAEKLAKLKIGNQKGKLIFEFETSGQPQKVEVFCTFKNGVFATESTSETENLLEALLNTQAVYSAEGLLAFSF